MTATQTETVTLGREDGQVDIYPFDKNEDPNSKSHYVSLFENMHLYQPGMTTSDLIDIARLGGLELKALCGHRFTPQHNPAGLEVCGMCVDVAANIIMEDG